MKIFLDANILVTVLNKEYPLFSFASRIISLHDNKRFSIYTSPFCLAMGFYFAEKKSGTFAALKKISLLSSKILIASLGLTEVRQTIANKEILDFEDGLEYYAALNTGCEVIITEDIGDFHFAKIKVLSCKQFIELYFPL